MVPLGMMNKDTKEPAEKILLCRNSAAPTVASFRKMKLSEIQKMEMVRNQEVENSAVRMMKVER